MIVAELSPRDLTRVLAGPGIRLRTGPVVASIRSSLPTIARGIALHYGNHPVEAEDGFVDFHVRVDAPANVRRWVHPQVLFHFDGDPPFRPLPLSQAFPMLEWGLNWCISVHCHQYLAIHSAVVERSGGALLLPAPPGSGKSTLCAGLVSRGWRLLSDELALIDPGSGKLTPLPRPISLKNASIDVIRRFASDAMLGPVVRDTVKGSVAHMKPPAESVRRALEPVIPRWIVLPKYEAGATASLTRLSKARTLMHLADNAFNYSYHGRSGFELLADVVDRSECYEFVYGDLEEAAAVFNDLAQRA